ncbi:monocarboxylate transporter 13-like, partial [Acanthaster planci]|uniref:Monocarboxylate transporter 13-like n=1 Tax=Acanthaster planci TaxID=133434 RepID=A0A8B7ZF13_ACAPL
MDSHRASSGTAQPSSVREETEESGQTAEVPTTDKDGQTEESEQTAEPKTNTGWAWVVLCGAFLVYFNALGFTMSLSVYLPVWMDYFEASSATTGLVISISTLWRGILSPLASALCNRYGPRVVTMMGGLMASGGAALLSLSPSIAYLIVVNLVSAFGISMVFVSAMQALALYFHKRYSFAVGIALAGISCGQLAYPPLITYLIDQYGWKGSILITAAINLHIVAAGALMRPVTRKKLQPETEEDQANTDQISINENASQRGHGVDIDDNAVVSGSSVGTGYREGSSLGEGDDDEETDDTGVAAIIADDATDTAEFINDCSAHPVEEIT